MPDEDPLVTALVDEGRFQEAFARLRRLPRGPNTTTVSRQLMLAELLEKTGQLADARRYLATLNRSSRLSDSERARALLVEGFLAKQMGHLEEAQGAFRRAWRYAERVDTPELACWCQLRLLGVSADLEGADLDLSLLSSLKRNIERAASPPLSIAHQIFLAEYHAKRGELATSRHHGSLAESVLSSFPSVWLRGLLDLHQSCLSYLEGNYLDSLLAARHALETSSRSGHFLTQVIAQADLAAAYLAVGQPARARACLASALRQSRKDQQIFGLLLETLAEAQLIVGDLAGCAESLSTARDLSIQLAQSRSAWHRAWNLRTEVRLLQRRGCWQESLSLIRNAGLRESPAAPSFTRAHIESLEALALVKLGLLEEASGVLHRVVQEALSASGSYRGSILPASAALSAATDGDTRAVSKCAQVLRIVGATGEASTLVEIVEQLIALLSTHDEHVGKTLAADCERPLWRPTRVMCHLDSSSRLLVSPASDSTELVAFLSALPDLTPDPLALGEESVRCLVSMNWIQCGSVIEDVDGERRTVVSYAPAVSGLMHESASSKESQGRIQVCLGSKQSRRYTLDLTPRESGQAAAACHGIVWLLASTHAVDSTEPRHARSTEDDQLTPEVDDSGALFRSPAMLALVASAKRVAPLGITVLLTGESGTGKEVVADIIHRASGASSEAFVAFNCSTVPRDMVDSQLFGYRRGAFTDAAQGFGGVISAAEGGTLLLDEVGELPLETQPKLLRFLDSGEVQALGEAIPRRLRVRVIAATNADLENLVQLGRFREDLYYRLNVVRFRLPPLRERREEILPLVTLFLAKHSSEFGKNNIHLSDAAREHLLLYSWPGNIRQLSHELRRLVALSESNSVIDVCDLDTRLRGKHEVTSLPVIEGSRCVTVRIDKTLVEAIRQVESAAIVDAMESAEGRLDLAAKRLGLSRKGLFLKRQRLGLP